MLPRAALFIGIFLCLTHVTQCYILFSANIEDIKKIARKLLPDNLVDKLTDVMKKFSDKKGEISDDNEVNSLSVNKLSEDETDYTKLKSERKNKKKPGIKRESKKIEPDIQGDSEIETNNENKKDFGIKRDPNMKRFSPKKREPVIKGGRELNRFSESKRDTTDKDRDINRFSENKREAFNTEQKINREIDAKKEIKLKINNHPTSGLRTRRYKNKETTRSHSLRIGDIGVAKKMHFDDSRSKDEPEQIIATSGKIHLPKKLRGRHVASDWSQNIYF